ncbi:aspartate aminotransferase family protein [Verminephrobacter eiseniae]|uniref:Aminotransferase n=1 Tax=Verminephrobacter eiseniae (strain EF01-2) TaxID=391735 RepID=A1WML0_VEREI|nr:aspartate aminotransferase family protein [Verminephrobacter eiseniae]ABM58867.1 aminotransferase [Verminephrobacter eiseniae EF01-2]MCW5284431.1 aspartate aminotransferase family protein [Verminephrobacter eiseniae]MCW5302137.1 aspartate aminotransferase family protein [Verminephrobacter eiseniae]MCW8182148.1 aspartate aminotransferase family protein [Verminephrobacter eiseniae]MCW8191795.1 aspartate aminotransferase family protein [Verminephrobacter eiseniae]
MTKDPRPGADQHDVRHMLYPFANPSHLSRHPPLVIERGAGVYVYDGNGKRYLDGQGGLWNVNVGHGREEIKEAIRAQLDRISFYSIFGGTSNRPAIELADVLCRWTAQEGMARVFFSSGGSEANEAAYKLARQYWRQVGQPMRHKIISLKRAYHGVTLGALSANGITPYRAPFEPLLAGFIQVETPHVYRNPFTTDPQALGRLCAQLLEREIEFQGPDSVAAFVAEPVQGAGGVIVPPANFWPLVREVCDRHRVLLIADEVVTGFGRIGSEMGSRLWGVKPDMMVFAKGINSGYIPLGATMANARVCDAFVTTDEALFSSNAFLHGNTYAGHPLACVAAIANLEIIEKEKLHLNAGKVGAYLMERLQSIQDKHRYIGDVRGQGLMIGVELVADKKTRAPLDLSLNVGARISDACREAGVLLRNLADTFIISPPLTFTHANADEMVDAIDDAMSQLD